MAVPRTRTRLPSTPKTRICSRCHQEKPVAEFLKPWPKPRPSAEFRTCERCRVQLRELARSKAQELRWLRDQAPVPYDPARERPRRKARR